MATPEIIEPIMQKGEGDCAIASLAMLTGKPLIEVNQLATKVFKDFVARERGLYTGEIKRLGKKLGVTLHSRLSKTIDWDHDTGILLVALRSGTHHAAILFNGSIYDPLDGLFYTPDAYLATRRALRLLTC